MMILLFFLLNIFVSLILISFFLLFFLKKHLRQLYFGWTKEIFEAQVNYMLRNFHI